MRLPSLEVLATWPTPNYENPSETRGNQLLVVTCIVCPIALFMVAARMYSRIVISRCFGIDDVFHEQLSERQYYPDLQNLHAGIQSRGTGARGSKK